MTMDVRNMPKGATGATGATGAEGPAGPSYNSSIDVFLSAGQTITDDTITIVAFDSINWDLASEWDINNYYYTALGENKYIDIMVRIEMEDLPEGITLSTDVILEVMFYKNGNLYKKGGITCFTDSLLGANKVASMVVMGFCKMYLEQNDTFDVRINHNGTVDWKIIADKEKTWLSTHMFQKLK